MPCRVQALDSGGQMSRQHTRGNSAAIKYEPSLKMEFRPRFRCCGIPNPHGLLSCPACGAIAEKSVQMDADNVVMTFPLLARMFFRIGEWLVKWAKRIEGSGK